MVNMNEVWQNLDEEIAHCPMPEEYKDYHVQILCKDCHKVRLKYHSLATLNVGKFILCLNIHVLKYTCTSIVALHFFNTFCVFFYFVCVHS